MRPPLPGGVGGFLFRLTIPSVEASGTARTPFGPGLGLLGPGRPSRRGPASQVQPKNFTTVSTTVSNRATVNVSRTLA